MIYIFDEFDKITEEEYKSLYSLLPPSRKALASKRKGIKKKITIFEYFYLKRLLNFDGYPDFEYGENGKPFLRGQHFSISHSGNLLCIAIAESEVGVDTEKIIEYNEHFAKIILNENELKEIEKEEDKNLAITKFWTKKEAAIKCLGKSLKDMKNVLNDNELQFEFLLHGDYVIYQCKKSPTK